jgi:hypothetical protein
MYNLNKKDVRYNNASHHPRANNLELGIFKCRITISTCHIRVNVGAQAAYIDAAFQEWHRLTCVKFQKRQSTDKISGQYLYIQDDGSG